MQSNKTKSKVITFIIVVYSLLCFSYSVAVQDNPHASQAGNKDSPAAGLIKEADALFQQRKYSNAIKKYKEANNIEESFEAFKGIGSAYYQMAKSTDNDISLAFTVREMKKEDYLKLAIKNLSKAFNFQPEDNEIKLILKNTYDLYYNTFKRERPAASKESAKTEKVTDLNNLINEGDSLYTAKKYNDAIKIYKRANEIKETLMAYKGLGLCYIQKARDLDKKMPTPIRASRKNAYFRNSIKNLGKAGSFDPNDIEIRYLLADAFIFGDRQEYYELAETLFKQVIFADKKYKDAMIKLSFVYKRLGKYDESREMLNEYLEMKKADPQTLYQLSKLALEEGKFDEASGFLMQSLDNLTDSTAISEILEDIEIIFSDREKEEFRLAEHKGKFLKKFWLEKDPEPETEINERLIEHLRRVKFAYDNFFTQSTHGKYDDRGKIYIKYGEPDNKYISGGLSSLDADAVLEIDQMDVGVYSNESWVYYWGIGEYKNGLFFDFVNKGGKGYELVGDLREANYSLGHAGGSDIYERYYALFKAREDIDQKNYGRVARAFEKAVRFNRDRADGGMAMMEAYRSMEDEIITFRDNKIIMEQNSPAEAYLYYDKNQPLFVMASSASFRGKDGKTRQELYYSFPIGDLKLRETENSMTADLDETIILKNIDSKNLFQDTRKINLIYDKKLNLKNNSHIGQVDLEIPYQNEDYICFLKLKSNTDNKLGLLYREMNNKDYTGSSLMMSDIEFAHIITTADKKDIFTKNGLRIIPKTNLNFNREESIFIYFEIYNLMLDNQGSGSYSAEYTISKRKPDDKQKNKYFNMLGKEVANKKVKDTEIIRSSWVEPVKKRDAFSWQSIDMSGLSEGLYDLSVQITDLISKTTTSSEYPFVLGKK